MPIALSVHQNARNRVIVTKTFPPAVMSSNVSFRRSVPPCPPQGGMLHLRFAVMLRLGVLLSFGLLTACVNPPEFPAEPVITFESLSDTEIHQFTSGPIDSIQIHFSFTDGDGDLSGIANDSVDIFLTDSRLPIQTPFAIPVFPSEGTGNGISGDIFISIVNTNNAICCIANNRFCVSDPNTPVDTFSYAIQIRDRAGNFSNEIRTPPINILCLGQ